MKSEVVIYHNRSGAIELKGDFKEDTVWANLNQVADLFGRDKSVISRHIKNIYKSNELRKLSTVAKIATVQKEGKRKVTRKIDHYNLDVILSIGYRVDSKQATRFRIWAGSILKKYLIQGYAINEKRLKAAHDNFIELKNTITFLSKKSQSATFKGEEAEILHLLQSYAQSFTLLEQYDRKSLPKRKGKKGKWILKYSEAKIIIQTIKRELIFKKETTELFGQEISNAFDGIVGNIYQTFDGNELYENIESKAAHLLYFIIKDHPFSDGNKRSASFLFVYFLGKNHSLYRKSGERKIDDNALTSLALLVAESDPKEKDIMIRLIMNLIA